MSKRHAVVVGGLGVIGRALVDHLTSDPSWDVVALSRRAPDFETTARFLSVDLRDKDSATAVQGICNARFINHVCAGLSEDLLLIYRIVIREQISPQVHEIIGR